MSEKSSVGPSTVDWEEQRPASVKRPRSRVWPVVLGILAALVVCSLLSLAVTFGIIGVIVDLIDSPTARPVTTIEFDEYGRGYGMPDTRGSQRRGCGECGCCPYAGDPGSERGYIEYYYEGEEGALPGERRGRVIIELDAEDIKEQQRFRKNMMNEDTVEGEISIPIPAPAR